MASSTDANAEIASIVSNNNANNLFYYQYINLLLCKSIIGLRKDLSTANSKIAGNFITSLHYSRHQN